MSYGGITFEHVWAYQIKCMMANQYNPLVNAIGNGNIDDIIITCLRLGWNDAFRHVSKNKASFEKMTNTNKENEIIKVCKDICGEFKAYIKLPDTRSRSQYIENLFATPVFSKKFDTIKVTDPKDPKYGNKALCFGHIQKMFNMAIKLLLCLVISAEQADALHIEVKLRTDEKDVSICLTDNNWWKGIFDKDNFDADCPLDSKILEKIVPSNTTWSKYGSNDYKCAQDKIGTVMKQTYPCSNCCNLLFDFENWN